MRAVRGAQSRFARSRLRYRLARLWRRRAVRRFALAQAPALAAALAFAQVASDPATHAAVDARLAALREAVASQEAFRVRRVAIEGAGPTLKAEITAALADAPGASTLDLDVDALRRRVESLGWAARARVSLEAPETLRVEVVEREAAAVWRVAGEPWLIDAGGARIDPAFSRADHPDLPLLAGAGADRAVAEALAVIAAAGPLAPRIRGLVRMGERRWDVALAGGAGAPGGRVMLPARDAVAAMEAARGMFAERELFDGLATALDMRAPDRPVLRLSAGAAEDLRLRRETAAESGEDA